jgi:hypothetical protein
VHRGTGAPGRSNSLGVVECLRRISTTAELTELAEVFGS